MAAEAKISIVVEVTDLGQETSLSHKFTHSVTPEEVFHGYAVIGATACDLDVGTIAVTEISGIFIIAKGTAKTDYVGILINDDGTGTPATDDGNQVLNAGEACYINLYGGLDTGKVIRLKGAAATSAIEYYVFGAHT